VHNKSNTVKKEHAALNTNINWKVSASHIKEQYTCKHIYKMAKYK